MGLVRRLKAAGRDVEHIILLRQRGTTDRAIRSRLSSEELLFLVGTSTPIKVDVRIIAATNRKLEKLVEEGKFREDLFYRLNVVNLELPPLRGLQRFRRGPFHRPARTENLARARSGHNL